MQQFQRHLQLFRDHATDAREKIFQPKNAWILTPLAAFLVTRIIIFFSAYLAEVAIPGMTGPAFWHASPNNIFLDVWARWDSAFYMRIVEQGYSFVLGQQNTVAFFPFYSMLVSVLNIFTNNDLLAGFIVSNLSLFGALVFLYRLTEFEFKDTAIASRTVLFIAIFPTSFFFTAVYTESLFLLLSVATVYFARRQMWAWATLTGFLCSGTRIIGFLVWGVVILEWLRAHGWMLSNFRTGDAWRNLWQGLRHDLPSLAFTALIPFGLFSYMAFLATKFHDPIAFWTTQAAWGRQASGPIQILQQGITTVLNADWMHGQIPYQLVLNMVALGFGLLTIIAIWRRLGASYAIYSTLSILIPAASGLGSLMRYVLVVFPLFMMLAVWSRNRIVERAILVGFAVILGILTTVFVNWIFVA
jgi:hypothetical protein